MTAARKKPARAGPAALKRGPWSPDEDELLRRFVAREGEGRWRVLPRRAGLRRCGKSCRLRWMNYLRPDIKRGPIADDEEDLILRLHRLLGNRWSLIAGRLPGRTDNEIKNYWNSHLSKKLVAQGIDPRTHKPLQRSSNRSSNNTTNNPPISVAEPSSSRPPPPPPPSLSPPRAPASAGLAGGDDGGRGTNNDLPAAATTVGGVGLLDSDDGFEGFFFGDDDELIRAWDNNAHLGGGFDWCDPVVGDDDGTFSAFLDSLVNEDHQQFVHYFGDHHHQDAADDDSNKDRQGGAS